MMVFRQGGPASHIVLRVDDAPGSAANFLNDANVHGITILRTGAGVFEHMILHLARGRTRRGARTIGGLEAKTS